jgi:hypothetical protein
VLFASQINPHRNVFEPTALIILLVEYELVISAQIVHQANPHAIIFQLILLLLV